MILSRSSLFFPLPLVIFPACVAMRSALCRRCPRPPSLARLFLRDDPEASPTPLCRLCRRAPSGDGATDSRPRPSDLPIAEVRRIWTGAPIGPENRPVTEPPMSLNSSHDVTGIALPSSQAFADNRRFIEMRRVRCITEPCVFSAASRARSTAVQPEVRRDRGALRVDATPVTSRALCAASSPECLRCRTRRASFDSAGGGSGCSSARSPRPIPARPFIAPAIPLPPKSEGLLSIFGDTLRLRGLTERGPRALGGELGSGRARKWRHECSCECASPTRVPCTPAICGTRRDAEEGGRIGVIPTRKCFTSVPTNASQRVIPMLGDIARITAINEVTAIEAARVSPRAVRCATERLLWSRAPKPER